MAKVPKVKKRVVSIHSRAARRADSPSLNTDKSLLNAKRIESTAYSGSAPTGIRKKHQKPLTRAQRLRRQKGVERADAVIEKHSTKVDKSLGKMRTIKERAKEWTDLNGKLGGVGRFGVLAAAEVGGTEWDNRAEGNVWEDVDDFEEGEGDVVEVMQAEVEAIEVEGPQVVEPAEQDTLMAAVPAIPVTALSAELLAGFELPPLPDDDDIL